MFKRLKTPLWKLFWLWTLPVLLVFQLIWGVIFKGLTQLDGFSAYSQVILVKLVLELLIYLLLPLYFYRATTNVNRNGYLLITLFFAILFGLTAKGLLAHFVE